MKFNMIESALSLWDKMNDALKANSDRELCFPEDDKIVLMQLYTFLKPFGELTHLVSVEALHLSLLPLITCEITDAAKMHDEGEDDSIVLLKQVVLDKIDTCLSIIETTKVVALLDPSVKRIMVTEIGVPAAKQLLLEHERKAVERLHSYRRSQSRARAFEGETFVLSQILSCRTPVETSFASTSSQELSVSATSQSMSKKQKLAEKYALSDTTREIEVLIENEVNTYMALDLGVSEIVHFVSGRVNVTFSQTCQYWLKITSAYNVLV